MAARDRREVRDEGNRLLTFLHAGARRRVTIE
jgi:hypothetical protein